MRSPSSHWSFFATSFLIVFLPPFTLVDNDTIDKIKNRFAELKESYRQYPNIVVLAEIIELNYQYREIDQTGVDLFDIPYKQY